MDLTRRYPFCYSRGSKYMLIVYHYDANAIIGLTLRNRQAAMITKAWKQLHQQFEKSGLATNTRILDNETSG